MCIYILIMFICIKYRYIGTYKVHYEISLHGVIQSAFGDAFFGSS